jgi:hypothetical protein
LPFIQKRVAGLGEVNEYCQHFLTPPHMQKEKYTIDAQYDPTQCFAFLSLPSYA